MKILVLGGTGNVGSKVVRQLRALNHNVIAGAPANGINSFTGEGLAEAMQDTEVVIDLANSPKTDDESSMNFFETTGRNLIAAEINAGIKHHVVISIVGADKMTNLGYMRAKKRQEDLIKESGLPYTIIRSTQFFEFVAFITQMATQGNEVYAPGTKFQPIAVDEVAGFVVKFALGEPLNATVEVAGPESYPKSEFIKKYVAYAEPSKTVVETGKNEYFGIEVPQDSMVPGANANLGKVHFSEWLEKQV
ncbi:SDR family oxidoreductase [Dyadobacter sp. LJ53]|uniref:SDR family oxidoreductase n=1 Tax=Dyadobacter chenwenxiniae TaxID=2906456 RepID=UPI001F310CAA|nr:SDR family oxidoreductase [Dyadobacter chenwenxiniae]MCF0049303.1 SDR family oxidoreductase [Dyadobacter chenwenxiniae]